MPKTALGKRAAIEQANQLQLLDPSDPDQKYALLTTFGLSDLVPTLNYHVQAALQLQDSFERWVEMPQGDSPLTIKAWFDPHVHWVERVKWLNTDKMREIIAKNPQIEEILTIHLQTLQMLMAPPPQVGPDGKPMAPGGPPGSGAPPSSPKPQGAALAARNSNQNSGSTSSLPKGNASHGPNVGPS